jgi:GDP-L-fucose synthase
VPRLSQWRGRSGIVKLVAMDLAASRIWVTGGTGFLGRHLLAALGKRGAGDVFAPSSAEVDLLAPGAISRALAEFKPDCVIHLAARVGGIGANQKNPADYFYSNLMMGVPLLHACWEGGVAKFVGLGTVCAYPKFTPVPFKEDAIWDGYPEETNAPYGLAKKMLLVAAESYRAQYGYNAIFLLPVNLYGPGDNFDLESSHVIPALIRKFAAARDAGDEEVVCWGDGSPSREFLYVEDAAEGICLAAERYDGELPINLGSGREIVIKNLAAMIAREVGYSGRIFWDTSRPNGQPRRCLDTSRAEKLLGFKAGTSFETGLKQTVAWYLGSELAGDARLETSG